MSRSFIALYDACVLYPAPLRDLLMRLATKGIYRAVWSNQIHEEWISNLLKVRQDLTQEQLYRTRDLMNKNCLNSLITGYEYLIERLNLPDPQDHHVLAAAIHVNATTIVTFNLKDFPENELDRYGIEAMHPDEFIMLIADIEPGTLLASVKEARIV